MLLYRFLLTLLAPFIALALLIRVLRRQESIADFSQRLGFWRNLPHGKVIWLHAASNGELTAARPLIDGIAKRHSDVTLLITCNSTSARSMVNGWGQEQIDVRLAPLDQQPTYRKIMSRLDLKLFILIEADFWPNRLRAAQHCRVPIALIAGRVSKKSAKGWARFSSLCHAVFDSFGLICAQDDASENRLRALGAKPDAFANTVALKALQSSTAKPLDHAARKNLWLAASTHAGEDSILLQAHLDARRHIPDLRMILAPRHPKRATDIVQIAKSLGLSVTQRSRGDDLGANSDVYLADTLGEMDKWYRAAGVCFVAGSLVAKGGHTPFEPASHDAALLFGSHVENFAEPYSDLIKHGGARQCVDAQEIATALMDMQSAETANTLRANSHSALSKSQGLNFVFDALDRLLEAR